MATTVESPAAERVGSVAEHQLYINGEWRPAKSGKTFEVHNPATGELLARCADGGREEVQEAIEAAHAAFPSWSATPAEQRAQLLTKAAARMMERLDELSRLLTQENGKPVSESEVETKVAAAFFQWNGEEARRIYGEVVPSATTDKRVLTFKQPVGVVAAITPWNFPTSMVTRKVGPALAAGCTVVFRPARATPLVAVEIFKILEEVGFPKGVVNLVTGTNSAEMGDEMATNPKVRKLTFTGSTEVGKELLAKCAGTVKRVSLELGGHAPFIVFDDADLDKAAQAVVLSRFRNAGQTCICTNRLYAQRSIAPQLAQKVAELTARLKVGNGLQAGTDVGPLIDERGFRKVEEHVQDAVSKGGTVLAGGQPYATPNGNGANGHDGLKGWFYQPTVIGNAKPEMLVMHEETFGPVLPIMEFDTEEEAIRLANDTPYGLAAYFFARDVGRIFRVAEGLDYGIVGANDPLPTGPHIPFGGYKESGMGRENGSHGIEEFLEVKAVTIGL
ncbi:MAG TPA: NAD-dependent succinate-semialdehyde dehydrogenase [Chloroflexota bacterium]|jgi:succinate-semialdehyde dehydrogenase/glutarate-semialdehyde dehydrogenase|nr:NAD-dependent succinate-semialdehyde dehydrogenase [Chloroflexota bacterium]